MIAIMSAVVHKYTFCFIRYFAVYGFQDTDLLGIPSASFWSAWDKNGSNNIMLAL